MKETSSLLSYADRSVSVKVLTAVGLAAVVALVVGVTGLRSLSQASASAQDIYQNNVSGVRAVGELETTIVRTRVDVANQALSGTDELVKRFTDSFDKDVQAFDAALKAYSESRPAGDPAAIDQLQADYAAYVVVARTKLFPAGLRNDYAGWSRIRDAEVLPLMARISSAVDALQEDEVADAAANARKATSSFESNRILSIVILVVGLILALALGLWVARAIVARLRKVQEVCDALAAGDLTRTTGITTRDEPGRMGQALDSAVVQLRRTVETINSSATALSGASDRLTGSAGRIASSAEAASVRAQAVSAAAEQISRSVDTVSAGSEEMGASIREISENATEAARVAAEAVSVTAQTSATMSKLGESSAEIGNVIKVITAIAAQTNLLALNATIEAARAGDAGKGFAVVASEVKDLAQETARATEDISRRVEAIQADTTGAVLAIDEISQVIARISDYQTTIASAVEEQTATTAEMNRSVSEAAGGTGEIAQNISGVADAARETSENVDETQRATAELSRMSTELSAVVSNFRY